MNPSLQALSPEQKRVMLARLLEKQQATCKTAFLLQAVFLNTMIQAAPVWNIRSTQRFFHKLDPEMVRARMQRIIDRHPALRTTYHLPAEHAAEYRAKLAGLATGAVKPYQINVDARIEQRVHPAHTLEFKVVDARGWSPEKLREALLADAAEPYDLAQLPVCRLRLYQREVDDLMQFDVHHCAADLWSLEQIWSEMEKPEDGPPPPSFAEFCNWQHAWFSLPKAEEVRQWWRQELEGCPDLAFPALTGKATSESVFFRLDSKHVALARQHCRTCKITLFNVLLSAYQVALGRMFGRDDLAVGGTVANRPAERFEHSVGFFAQLVMYRRKLHQVGSWRELWEQNRQTIAGVLNHQFYPLTSTTPTPRTDFWLLYHQYRTARWLEDAPPGEPLGLLSSGVMDSSLGPWELLLVEHPYNTAPVLLEVTERKHEIQGLFRYRTECFDAETASRYVEQLQACLQAALTNPEGPLTV